MANFLPIGIAKTMSGIKNRLPKYLRKKLDEFMLNEIVTHPDSPVVHAKYNLSTSDLEYIKRAQT